MIDLKKQVLHSWAPTRVRSPSLSMQRTRPDFVQTSPEESWHRFSAANPCRGKTSPVLPLQLTSDHLYYFIFPQITPVFHYLCLSHSLFLSLALAWLQHSSALQRCISSLVFLPSFLPLRCLTRRPLPSWWMHAAMCFYLPLTRHPGVFTCGQHLRFCRNRKHSLS